MRYTNARTHSLTHSLTHAASVFHNSALRLTDGSHDLQREKDGALQVPVGDVFQRRRLVRYDANPALLDVANQLPQPRHLAHLQTRLARYNPNRNNQTWNWVTGSPGQWVIWVIFHDWVT